MLAENESRNRGEVSRPRLRLSILGGFSLNSDTQPVVIRSRKAQVLLGYLALSPNLRQTREQLAGLLWSDFPETQARASLRQTLRGLRQTFDELGLSGLLIERGEASLDPRELEVDVWSVLQSVDQAEPHAQLLETKRLSESLLFGLEDVDAAVRSWLMVQRQNLHERMVFALESKLSAMGDEISPSLFQTAKKLAMALSNLDPTHEGACRRLMLIHARDGDVPRALSRYNALYHLLDSDYDMEPSTETQNLVALIKTGGFESTQPVPSHQFEPLTQVPTTVPRVGEVLVTGNRLRLVIAAFRTDSIEDDRGDAPQRHLVIGFRHQLISSLIRFREWSVIDGKQGDVPERLPETEQAVYQVDGTAFQAGEQIQLVITVSNRKTGEYIWSEEYLANLEQWFATQRHVVRKMAVALNVHLSADRISQVVGEPDVSLPVYDRWLKGEELAQLWRPKNRVLAAKIFRSIIDDAPGFAPAYCSLVNFTNSIHLIFPGVFRTDERAREALSLAKMAVSLGPTNSRAQLCAAWSYAINGQFDQAELGYQMAYQLNENDPWTLISSTLGLAFCGRHDIALARAEQALGLGLTVGPLYWGYQAVIRFLCEDYEGSVNATVRAEDVIYNFVAWKASALGQLGRVTEAKEEWSRFAGLARSDWHGNRPHDEPVIAEWLLHSFPIRLRADWERLRHGLQVADVPVETITEP